MAFRLLPSAASLAIVNSGDSRPRGANAIWSAAVSASPSRSVAATCARSFFLPSGDTRLRALKVGGQRSHLAQRLAQLGPNGIERKSHRVIAASVSFFAAARAGSSNTVRDTANR